MKKILLSGIFILLAFTVNVKSEDFYDINTINTLELTFTQSNWDYLLDRLYAAGDEERLLATAVVNGIQYDSVGVRYKGNSSYDSRNNKNPLNIKLDYTIDDQEHEGYGTLKLANVYKDPSFVREVLSYEIAREFLPTSQANFIKVTINGTYIGLYSSVQSVDKHFLRTNYYSGDNPFFKGELVGNGLPTTVKVWGYFGADSASYSDYFELKSDYGWADLINFLDILNNTTTEVEDVLNVDRHLWMLAFDNLMVNLDAPINYAHNYYLYQDDAGCFNPVIWDLNENFGVFSSLVGGASLNTTSMQQMDPFLNSTNTNYPILNKILTDTKYRKMYVAHMKTIMDTIFSSGWYRTRALEIQDIIATEVQNDPNKFYTYANFLSNVDNSITTGGGRPGQSQSIVGITQLMDGRISYLNTQSEFQASAPEISSIANNPANVSPNTTVWITADVSGASLVQLAYRSSLTEKFEKVTMLDDGSQNDGSAGDGNYGISVPVGTTGFQYYIYAENNDAAAFLPENAEYEFYELTTTGTVVINEFMASNDVTVADQDGDYDDWIELYNNSTEAVSLNGYFLSDDSDELTVFTFPDTIIAAHDYMIIWADKDEEQSGLHAEFKLSASGEVIYLCNSDTTIIDEVTFGEQTTDITTGRYPDGTGDFVTMTPTFSAANVSGITGVENDLATSLMPDQFTLEQNYPNPFNPSTTIMFSLPSSSQVSLKIFNMLGEHVATLTEDELPAGNYQFQWNAANLANGIYYYTLSTESSQVTRKMLLLK